MIVSELIEMLMELDPDMGVVIDVGGAFVPCCHNSGEENISVMNEEDISAEDLTDEEIDNLETVSIFVLKPCHCDIELGTEGLTQEINLN